MQKVENRIDIRYCLIKCSLHAQTNSLHLYLQGLVSNYSIRLFLNLSCAIADDKEQLMTYYKNVGQ